MIYLIEELSDARLRLSELKNYITKALELVNESKKRDHIYEVAGHLIESIPDRLLKIEKAQDAMAMAAARLDYEEVRQNLTPEKAEELDRVLEDVRLRGVKRRSAMKKDTLYFARKMVAGLERNSLNLNDLRSFLHRVAEEGILAGAGEEFQKVNPKITDEEVEEINDQHEKNKDRFKDAGAERGLEAILRGLKQKRWFLSHGTVPCATSPDGSVRFWFKDKVGMTVCNEGGRHDINNMKTLGMRTRTVSANELLGYASKVASLPFMGRYEKGKPADPTENMSDEDAETWRDMNEKYEDVVKDKHKLWEAL